MSDIVEGTKKLTKWKNEPSFADLNNDKVQASEAQETHRTNLEEYELIRDGGKIPDVSPGKSKHRPKVVRKQQEWKYAAVEDPFMNSTKMFQISPRTSEDGESAVQNGILLNYQWSTLIDKQKLVEQVSRLLVDNGTVICKTLWDAEYGSKIVEKEQAVYADPEESMQMMEQAVAAGEMTAEDAQAMMEMGQPMQKGTEKIYVEEETLVKNQPDYVVRNSANVYIDPTCEGILRNAKFVIDEFNISFAELKKDEYVKEAIVEGDEDFDPASKRKQYRESGFYRNLSEIDPNSESGYDEQSSEENNSFEFTDKARKEMKAYEYWGFWDIEGDDVLVPIVATWIGKTIVRMEENPFAHKRIPFSMATYMPVKTNIHGEPDAPLLAGNQDVIAKQTRAAIDITATQAVGQEFIDSNLFLNTVERNNYEQGKTVYTRPGMSPKTSIHKQTVTSVPNTVFDMISMHKQDADEMSGTRAFNSSTNSGIESATKERGAMDATSKRESGILRRVAAMFRDMASMTIANNQALMPEEQVVRITNNFVKIRRDDLGGNIDLKLEVSTPEKDNAQAGDLSMLLQTGQQALPYSITQAVWAKIARLKQHEDLAEQIEETEEPGPSEAQLQMEQFELDSARLENEMVKMKMAKLAKDIEEANGRIGERGSREEENKIDMLNKTAQAKERDARTELYKEQADEIASRFVNDSKRDLRQEQIDDMTYSEEMKSYRENEKNKTALANKTVGEN